MYGCGGGMIRARETRAASSASMLSLCFVRRWPSERVAAQDGWLVRWPRCGGGGERRRPHGEAGRSVMHRATAGLRPRSMLGSIK